MQTTEKDSLARPYAPCPASGYIDYARRHLPTEAVLTPYRGNILVASGIDKLADCFSIGLILPEHDPNFQEDFLSITFPNKNVPAESPLPLRFDGKRMQLYDNAYLEFAVMVPYDVGIDQHLNGDGQELNHMEAKLSTFVEMRGIDVSDLNTGDYGILQVSILNPRRKDQTKPFGYRTGSRVPGYDSVVINTLTEPEEAGKVIRDLIDKITAPI